MSDVYNSITKFYREISGWHERFGYRLPDTMAQKYWDTNVAPAKVRVGEIMNLLGQAEKAMYADDRAARDIVEKALEVARQMKSVWNSAEWPDRFWKGRAAGGRAVESYTLIMQRLEAGLQKAVEDLNDLVMEAYSASDSQALAEAQSEETDNA